MRIAISADDSTGLDSVVSPHFGRCPYFVLVDIEGNDITNVSAVQNPFFSQHTPGQVPAFIHQQGVQVMLTGGMGARAISAFQQYGIQPVTGASGTVRHALGLFFRGQVNTAAPCKESQEHGHSAVPPEGEFERDEVGRLREEAETILQQLQDVERKLGRLGEE